MRRYSSKTLLFLSSSSPFPHSIFFSHFCTSSTLPSRLNFPRRHQEEESRNIRVSVWWDFENCNLPAGVNVYKVSQMITAAVRETGIRGPIEITAFGDVFQLSRSNQEALSSTGIQLTHVPRGGKNSADRSLIVDLMCWVSQNPPPAHLFLISGDRDFASVLHRLRMNNYNIMLASLDNAPSVLCSAASIMWRWNALVRGECLTGKIFNQPPGGPYGSWYGHYKGSLEDPFSVEQPTLTQTDLPAASSEQKIRPVPKAVVKQIKHILSSYPEGITLADLRNKLSFIDREYYGYQSFSRFLMSMPNILKRQTRNGADLIHGVGVKPKLVEQNSCLSNGPLSSDTKECDCKPIKLEGGEMSVSESVVQDPLPSSSMESSTEWSARKVENFSDEAISLDNEKPLKESLASHSNVDAMEVVNPSVAADSISSAIVQDSNTEVGFLKKLWRRWFGRSEHSFAIDNYAIPNKPNSLGGNSEKECENILDKDGPRLDSLGKKEVEKEIVDSSSQENHPVFPTSCSLSGSESTRGNETNISLETDVGKKGESLSFLSRIKQWCKFGAESPNSDVMADQPMSEHNQIQSDSGKHEIFSDDSFWRDMDSFFNSPQGALAVSQSKTREQMAKYIQKDGPLILKTLEESDVLQLVDILISEKKWVEEHSSSEASPFKLVRSAGQKASSGYSCTSNGLSSIFLNSSSQSHSERQPVLKEDGKPGRVENISPSGVTKQASNTKRSERSTEETLIDCKKLVNEIVKEYPKGYDISCFRELFLERYGYSLDYKKLGHPKLSLLLETLTGMKVESNHLIPSGKAPKPGAVPNSRENNTICSSESFNGELSDALQSDESDSAWEDLGPLTNNRKNKNALEEKCESPQYVPFVSDDEFSDSDGEPLLRAQQEGQAKSRMNSEDSTLLQILDSWYSSKDDINGKNKSENVEDMANYSGNGTQPSDQSGLRRKTGNLVEKHGKKQRPQKSYSFVADSDVQESDGSDSGSNNPNRLIDGIIGRLKTAKPSGVKMRS